MGKRVAVMMLVLGGCVADDAALPRIDRSGSEAADGEMLEQDAYAAICALAAELPPEDLCSLVCDPDAFAARLAEQGLKGGACYQVRCTLAPAVTVSVGACLR